MPNKYSKNIIFIVLIALILSIGFVFGQYNAPKTIVADDLSLDEQEATIRAIEKVSPAVVNIIVYENEEVLNIDWETGKQTISKEKVEKGSGTGFIISADGMILTNKHVVEAATKDKGSYRVILNNGKQYYAQFIDKDPLNDLAVIKIFQDNLPYVEFGDSDSLNLGASVVAIGNVLGTYQNSATKGIVSGLGRKLDASDNAGNFENLDNLIQTDAEINFGNSGGPLIDLEGKVIGINVATDLAGSSIGFAIPINDAKPAIDSLRTTGQIRRPKLGVKYIMITPEIYYDYDLPREDGALLIPGEDGSSAIVPDSPAEKVGLQEGDIIFEINGIAIQNNNSLLSVIQKQKPGDTVELKIQRDDEVLTRTIVLDEFK